MSFFQSLLLGLVQGLTEFFPVSSSAHLFLAKYFLNIPDKENLLYFDLVCHSGTLISLLIFLRKEVYSVLTDIRQIALYTLALIPLIPAYFLLKELRKTLSDPSFLGYALLITSALLFLSSKKTEQNSSKKWPSVLFIGVMQTIALIPGISRSGSTVSAARFCGWNFKEAALFSFLLSIPTILGAELIEAIKGSSSIEKISITCYAGGFFSSFIFGLFAVRFIFWIYEKEKIKPFAWYCLGVGLLAWTLFHG